MTENCISVENEYGHWDYLLTENDEVVLNPVTKKPFTVCPQCFAMVTKNRGQGCMCQKCFHEDLVECELNYMDTMLY